MKYDDGNGDIMTGVVRIATGKILNTSSGQTPQLFVGLNASKPSPGVGDMYIATDACKNYTCYVCGIWALVSSSSIIIAENHEGTITNLFVQYLAGAGTGTTNAGTHRYDMTTGTGIAGSISEYMCNFTVTPVSDNFEANILVQNIVNGVGGTRTFQIGIEGLHCELKFYQTDAGSWTCYTNDDVTNQTTNISDIVNGDLLTIKCTGGKIHYLVNGTIVATHSSISLVGVSGSLIAQVTGDALTSTARELSIDYMALWELK
jgi:hypothetical protein